MRMLVVGAGATGGFFGARLAQAGRDVTFLVRPQRAVRLREQGLRIVSPHGNATLRPRLISAGEIEAPFEAVLLTVKAFDLEGAMRDFAAAVGAHTLILPVLNGMKHMDELAARFGRGSVAGCAAKVSTVVDDEGRIVQLAPFQDLAYGEMDGSRSARIEALDEFMRGAGFDARLSPNIALEMWEKWALLATLGGITCLMRGTLGEIEAVPGGVPFMSRFFEEVTSIIGKIGMGVSAAFYAQGRALLAASKGSSLTSSMYRDLAAHRAIEADQILGDLLERGDKAGCSAPLVAAAYANLCVYQRARSPASV
ncbi:MAG TPA: 2-dehydropantoate 2-reductase [Steroidobacteraceae bacterium]|nr:2-dehydropantoate 2-reductase [Steroidobacteraceae bacterium]